MFNRRAKEIEKIETILLRAKSRDPKQYDSIEDKNIVVDAYNAMSQIEKNRYVELIPYLYHFMEDRDEYLREKAISSFGGFKVNEVGELKDKLFIIWNNVSEDDNVRFVALGVWAGFYRGLRDKEALKILYKLLKTSGIYISLRIEAMINILSVAGELEIGEGATLFSKIINLDTFEGYDENEFMSAIDWERINKIMEKYCPEALQN
jgi:hypothetical protein